MEIITYIFGLEILLIMALSAYKGYFFYDKNDSLSMRISMLFFSKVLLLAAFFIDLEGVRVVLAVPSIVASLMLIFDLHKK